MVYSSVTITALSYWDVSFGIAAVIMKSEKLTHIITDRDIYEQVLQEMVIETGIFTSDSALMGSIMQ